ncbi:uncharacterized protein [Hemitrygon akajei]|uniref:uncharacterized protein n=1 Tax=Hemitrygon akajei TaxID=2704970 RepID=UPI003BF94414
MGNKGSKREKGKGNPGANDEKYPGVPPDSPLGRMLENWDYGRRKGKSKKKMIQYCEFWSRQPIQGSAVWWPKFGSSEDWVQQALNLYVNSKPNVKPEESDYALCLLPTTNSYKLKMINEGGQKKNTWEVLNHLPPPYVPPTAPQIDDLEARESENESVAAAGENADQGEEGTERAKPRGVEARRVQTRSQTAKNHKEEVEQTARLYPLREVPMGGAIGGTGYVNVPLTSAEVRNFKKEMKGLLEDPMGLAEQLDQFLGPNIYTWDEMYSIMGTLFSTQERQMIRQAAIVTWEKERPNEAEPQQKFPLVDPGWDKQTEGGRKNMRDMREFLIKGIRQVVPKGHNFTKAFGNHQNPDETPTDFLDRIRKNMQQYAGVDPEKEVGQQLIRVEFVSKAWPDIRKKTKLEKLEDWNTKPLSELLREAQKVFVRRDEEKQKTARIMVQTVRQVTADSRERDRDHGWIEVVARSKEEG